jgi:rhodanese-related sulfurtransferase
LETLSRHALAQLLERGAAGGRRVGEEGGPMLLDMRRCDEHSLYGAIPGAAHLPAEQLPRALAMAADEWARTFRFPQPHPDAACVLYSRGERRARWAALLLGEAGLGRCLLLREGAVGWRLDTCVKRYDPYAEGDPPPAPEPFALEEANASDGDEELYSLDLL